MRKYISDILCSAGLALLALWLMPPDGGKHVVPFALLVNASVLNAVFTNLKTLFNKAFEGAPTIWEKTTMRVPSSGSQNTYKWLSGFPKMRKWVGDKVYKQLKAHTYTIVNDDYEATVVVDRNLIKDDEAGMVGVQAQDAGFSAKQWPDEIDADLKNGAFANLCYDNQYFYDTDHPVEDGNGGVSSVSNKLTVALSNATNAAVTASYGAARQMIMGFTDNEGRPLGLVPDTLEVCSALEAVGNAIANNEKLADGTPNPYQGTCKVVVNPRLTSTTQWMLHVTTRPIRPFIFQEREKPVFVAMTDINSPDVFNRKEFKFGAEARGAGGYGLWQLSVGSTGTA